MAIKRFDLSVFAVSFLALTFLFAVTGCVLIFVQWFIRDCLIWECAPHRSFTVFDLGVPKGYTPNNSSIELYPDRGIINATEEAFGQVEWRNGKALYEAVRFGTEKQAVEWFDHQSNLDRHLTISSSFDQNQEVLSYSMSNADEYKIQCGYILEDFRCIFEARYEEFYLFFSGSIGENEMSDQDFIGVMNYVDTKMDELLNSEK